MITAHVMKMTRMAGAENHLLTLLDGQRKRQVDAQAVILVEPSNPMLTFVEAARERSIPLHSLVIERNLDFSVLLRLRALLSHIRPQVVHTHLQHADLYGILAARTVGVPVVVTSRHNDNAFRRRPPFRQINRLLWRLVDAGIAISDALGRFVVEVEGAPAHKIQTIHYGIAAQSHLAQRRTLREPFQVGLDDPLIGIVCRLVEQKGVTYGLRAFKQISERFPTARLLIAGDGPLRPALEAETAALGLAERVHFLGWRDDVPRLMAALDVLLVPSLWEGFGLVILEAMAQQVPTVASGVSAIPEIVLHGETGLLVPPRDADALAAALATLLSDAALRRYMGLLAEERVETYFTVDRMVDQTIALYEQLLKRKGA